MRNKQQQIKIIDKVEIRTPKNEFRIKNDKNKRLIDIPKEKANIAIGLFI